MSAQEHLTPGGVLLAAAELLEKPGAWTQGGAAFDREYNDVLPTAPEAICWCAWGAVCAAAGGLGALERKSFGYLAEAVGLAGWDPSSFGRRWNDAEGRTQAEVVSALRAAAELSSEGEG